MRKPEKLRFVCYSLAWALLLYGVVFTTLNWSQISNKVAGKQNTVIVRESTDSYQPHIKVSIDSLGQNIKSVGSILKKIQTAIN